MQVGGGEHSDSDGKEVNSMTKNRLFRVAGAAAVLLLVVTTYLYSVLRVRYPSNNDRWEP